MVLPARGPAPEARRESTCRPPLRLGAVSAAVYRTVPRARDHLARQAKVSAGDIGFYDFTGCTAS